MTYASSGPRRRVWGSSQYYTFLSLGAGLLAVTLAGCKSRGIADTTEEVNPCPPSYSITLSNDENVRAEDYALFRGWRDAEELTAKELVALGADPDAATEAGESLTRRTYLVRMENLGLDPASEADAADYLFFFGSQQVSVEFRARSSEDAASNAKDSVEVLIHNLDLTVGQATQTIKIVDASDFAETRRSSELAATAAAFRAMVQTQRAQGGPFALAVYCKDSGGCSETKAALYAASGEVIVSDMRKGDEPEPASETVSKYFDLEAQLEIPDFSSATDRPSGPGGAHGTEIENIEVEITTTCARVD